MSYSRQYFQIIGEESRSSARLIVPLVLEHLSPASVVDVGCGTGEWLAEFKRNGVANVMGLDGSVSQKSDMVIAEEDFGQVDLSQRFELDRKFELAISLEVAEHLPPSSADVFVTSLTSLAPAVLFSAAIPNQGGEHHLNEQWPDYWVNLFAGHGFSVRDRFRARLWNNPSVAWWYAQNLLLFVSEDAYGLNVETPAANENAGSVLPLVHPRAFEHVVWRQRAQEAATDIASNVPTGEKLVLADDWKLGHLHLPRHVLVPLVERNSTEEGVPRSDTAAADALAERLSAGIRYFALAWPAFWMLDHCPAFAELVRGRLRPLAENDKIKLFQLK